MPESLSLARLFYEQIIGSADPAAFIRGLVSSSPPTREEEWLDFKLFVNDRDAKETWSAALSGFANTGGGVLVWGIDARKDPTDQIDAACKAVPIAEPAKLVSRLKELHRGATDPPVMGVEIREFLDAESSEGFVVCSVPESKSKPHRAEHVKNKPYYLRAGDNFVIAGPSVLRSLFYPQTSASFRVFATAGWEDRPGADKQWRLDLRIQNVGTATAQELWMIMPIAKGSLFQATSEWHSSGTTDGIGAWYSFSLHPSMTVSIGRLIIPPSGNIEYEGEKPFPRDPVRLPLRLFCLNQERKNVELEITKQHFFFPADAFADSG
jgi:hypothetical protein